MALNFVDRLTTILVTATLTSAAWIVAGGVDFSGAADSAGKKVSAAADRAADAIPATAHPTTVVQSVEPTGSGLVIPVAGVTGGQLSNTFTDARGGGSRLHEALDIMAAAGTPVIAAGPGTVEKLFKSDDGGNTIYVRSPDKRSIHYYAHLQEYAAGLHEGQAVRAGEALGKVGFTGNANPAAPHLHFAIMQTTPAAKWYEPSTAINPYPLLAGNKAATNGKPG